MPDQQQTLESEKENPLQLRSLVLMVVLGFYSADLVDSYIRSPALMQSIPLQELQSKVGEVSPLAC